MLVVWFSYLYLASCCHEKLKPFEWSKSGLVPLSVHKMEPSEPEILKMVLVCREESR